MWTTVSTKSVKKSIELIDYAALQAIFKSDCEHIFDKISSSIYPIFKIFVAFWSENFSGQAHRESALKISPENEIAYFSKPLIFDFGVTKSTALNSELLLKIF